MIFVDSRETSIPIANAVPVEGLEASTGADILISRLSIPAKTHALLKRHIEANAILVQLKIGEDLASSVGDRLNDSLARMVNVTNHTASRLLLFIGVLTCDNEGSAHINGYRTHRNVSFATLDGAVVGWLARGGIYYSLSRIGLLDGWCRAMERRLVLYESEPVKYVFGQSVMPDELDGPLQLPVRIRDGRNVLIGFRGLGPELVNRIWAFTGDFKSALAFITDPHSAGKLEGFGPKTIASIRKQCGLGDEDGLIGWGRDAVDAPEPVAVARAPKSATEIAKDTDDLFGKRRNGAKV